MKKPKRFEFPKLYFSESSIDSGKTLDAWTGGGSYKHLGTLEFFGINVQLWRKS